MSYQRDFTIGLRETQDFYLSLVLGRWRKGIAGFGLVGALAALLYTMNTALALPVQAAAVLAGALAGAGIAAAVVLLSTLGKVREQVRRSGRERYVQETEINGFGVHVTVGKDRAKMDFMDLLRVQETRKAFYLFLSANQAWILPKAQMEEGDCARLRGLFSAVIEKGKLNIKGSR